MQAMVLERPGKPLTLLERPDPRPGIGEVRVEVAACGVCRTDLHVVDGELQNPKLPIVPGHEIVGHIDMTGEGVGDLSVGQRVGVPWLGWTCGQCRYCRNGCENLCDRPLFTGYTRDGGYATHLIADARYVLALPENGDDVATAALLCAGLIGWRSLQIAGDGEKLGLFGFGAAAHIIAQVARWQGREVFAFTRKGDDAAQAFAKRLCRKRGSRPRRSPIRSFAPMKRWRICAVGACRVPQFWCRDAGFSPTGDHATAARALASVCAGEPAASM